MGRRRRTRRGHRRRWVRRLVLAAGVGAVLAYRKQRLDAADRAFPPPPTL